MIPDVNNFDVSFVSCKVCEDVNTFYNTFYSHNYNTNKDLELSIVHQNIRSYKKNFDDFLVVLSSLKVKFHFIVLTEAWLSDDSNLMHVDGYNMFRTFDNLNNNDGVVVYVDNTLSVNSSQLRLGGVATALSLTFDWAGQACELLAVYRSPSSNLLLFNDGIESHLNQNNPKHDLIQILAGDINCDLIDVVVNSQQQRYTDILAEYGFVACIDKVTRPSSNTCLDHFFVKLPKHVTANSVIAQTTVTDHFTISLNLSSNKHVGSIQNSNNTYLKYDWKGINAAINSTNWKFITENHNLNSCVDSLTNRLSNIMSEFSKQVTCSSKSTKLKPWITNGLVKSIRHRDKLHKLLKSQPFNANLRQRFVCYRNTLHSLIKRAKFDYYKDKINASKGDARKFWSTINEIAGRPSSKGKFPIQSFYSGDIINQNIQTKEVCQNFCDYFAGVGEQLASAITPSGPTEVNDADHVVNSVFEMTQVTAQELMEVVKGIKGRSAPGWDGIPATLIKNNIVSLLEPLLYIINFSICTGEFPNTFKVAKVIPIFKSGQKNVFSNFRPISMLVVLAKILEKIVKIQFSKYLQSEHILTDLQYGFRTNKNTSNALFDMTYFISNKKQNNNKVLITFLDLAKAFDSVDRLILLKKLECIGVKNTSLSWFKSYLQDRKQIVSINNVESNASNIDYGVIQGSTLGPILFLVYINNISKLSVKGKLFLFADDTALVSTGDSWEGVYENASEDLLKLKSWFDNNILSVNAKKTKCLPIFSRSVGEPSPSLTLKMHSCGDPRSVFCSCSIIERVEQFTYLGVVVDQHLRWAPHVQYIQRRVRKLMYAFSQLGRVLTVDHCRTAYFAYVQSLIEYGIVAWGGASPSVLEPLAVAQRSLIKVLLKKDRRYPSTLLFQEFKVLNIRQLFVKTLLIFIRFNKDDIFSEIQHNYQTRHRLQFGFETPRLRHGMGRCSSFNLAHNVYRNLLKISWRLREATLRITKIVE